MEGGEPRGDGPLPLHPVETAEKEDRVELVLLGERRGLPVDDHALHLAEELWRFVEEEVEPLRPERAPIGGRPVRVGRRDDQLSTLREKRREELGVPALAGAILEHGHLRRDAEELERLDRVPVDVPIGVARLPVRALQRRIEASAQRLVLRVGESLRLLPEIRSEAIFLGLCLGLCLRVVLRRRRRVLCVDRRGARSGCGRARSRRGGCGNRCRRGRGQGRGGWRRRRGLGGPLGGASTGHREKSKP